MLKNAHLSRLYFNIHSVILFTLRLCVFFFSVLILNIFSTHYVWSIEVHRFEDTTRIVSVGGALTEIVYALDAQNDLIARDTTSMYPSDALKLPDIGYMRALSPEGILSLNPHGILLVEGSGPSTTIEILANTSVPMIVVPENFTKEGIIEKIKIIGQALHREKQSNELIKKVVEEFKINDDFLNTIKKPKKILFALSVQNGRVMASGKNTAADGVIKLSGAVNAINEFEGYKILNDEAIINAAPDLILMMDHGGVNTSIEDVMKIPSVTTTPAAKNKAVIKMDGLYLLSFGPRTPLAVRELAHALYGKSDQNTRANRTH
ncbi:heme/hemin ABC transporter substrate-binding protein [Bartonella tamiae]|uniref:Fe/B12 periplasmic-binding domain-containing protein n=1 Tax=Bartonella tamiae Th239 TaxID=1094558 RepID=J0ZPT6_9HYPH|nr:ABC transporter substrate-binding protein [Bartonella tamiae]EJF90613.1 hypothetical protein ME5_01014 [Bartonella tamiae Th239]EJF94009.1 hypothetical protein MEG_00867 [Bartonella tamiae Th307]